LKIPLFELQRQKILKTPLALDNHSRANILQDTWKDSVPQDKEDIVVVWRVAVKVKEQPPDILAGLELLKLTAMREQSLGVKFNILVAILFIQHRCESMPLIVLWYSM